VIQKCPCIFYSRSNLISGFAELANTAAAVIRLRGIGFTEKDRMTGLMAAGVKSHGDDAEEDESDSAESRGFSWVAGLLASTSPPT